MRKGVRLGIDHGDARIGVARSDPDGFMAVPVETVANAGDPIAVLAAHVADFGAVEVIVGLPLLMSGKRGTAAQKATDFARALAERIAPIPVRAVDERLSTVESSRSLAAIGRNTRKSRSVIDQVAAVTILQGALDEERRTGKPAGAAVGTEELGR